MELVQTILITCYIAIAIAIIILVLIQHGKGASTGASFGGGASGSLFGASGSANFLSRTTAAMITLFFIISLFLSYLSIHTKDSTRGSVIEAIESSEKASNIENSSKNPEESKNSPINSSEPFSVPSK